MVQYKLYYFDMPGRAEPIRMIFQYAGQPFEDVRIPRDQWPSQKSKFFYGQIPVLEVDGKQLCQSFTIAQYLGKQFGLAGKDEWEQAKASEITDYLKDMGTELFPYMAVKMGFRQGDADKLREEVFLPGMQKHVPMVEKLLDQASSGFMLASGVSYLDFLFVCLLLGIKKIEAEELGKYPKLCQYVDKVVGLPQLKEYISKLPQ